MRRARTVDDLGPDELDGQRLLVRVDYNVPLGPNGEVTSAGRIEATLPTLERLGNAGATAVLVSHLGRPEGKRDPAASLAPVARDLSGRLGYEVPLLEAPPGSTELETQVAEIPSGRVALLENIRFHPGETKNDPDLSAALAALAGGFVGEAFGTAHRAHASNVGAAERIRADGGAAVAGLLMAKELHFLKECVAKPERPFVAILGGAKISGKIELIRAILPKVDRLLIGGAMANTFFRALGLETGSSLVEDDRVSMAAELLELGGDTILLPVDCVVADEIREGAETRVADRQEVGPEDRIGDIGPRSTEIFSREVRGAKTILWNGPMGVFELEPFARGTNGLAHVLAERADAGVPVVVGGGDSAAAAEAAGVAERMTHVSTGGGASLDLLAGSELPGVAVLEMVETETG